MDAAATGHHLTNRHRSREVVGTGHKQHMTHLTLLQLIHQGCEIAERVLGPVVELDPLRCEPLLLDQPGGVLPIAAATDQQGQIQLPGEFGSHPLPVHITTENQHQLRWTAIQQGLAIGHQRARTHHPDHQPTAQKHTRSHTCHHTTPTGEVG